jgi:hypothetical protein
MEEIVVDWNAEIITNKLLFLNSGKFKNIFYLCVFIVKWFFLVI